jgi:hypothetical protein
LSHLQGIVLLAKNPTIATKFQQQLKANTVTKRYVARVIGKFPYDEIEVNQPLKCIDHVKHTWGVSADGVETITRFKLLFTTGSVRYILVKKFVTSFSVVECQPLTGRTHQIRVHLQWLGHPIINDPLYNAFYSVHRIPIIIDDIASSDTSPDTVSSRPISQRIEEKVQKLPDDIKEQLPDADPVKLLSLLQNCADCGTERRDPFPEELFIYLHAFEYKGADWEFSASLPYWSQENFEDPEYFKIEEQLYSTILK